MNTQPKLERVKQDGIAKTGITISEKTSKARNGSEYVTYRVQGWREDGKWQRKQFKDEGAAKRFAAEKTIEMQNEGVARRLFQTSLDEDTLRECELALKRLGGTYSITSAVDYFLANHRAPDFTIAIADGLKHYLDALENSGVRANTIRSRKSVLLQFMETLDDPEVHEVTTQQVKAYLDGLRAKDGITKAKRKTFNNYKNDLNHFFSWSCAEDKTTNRPYSFTNPVDGIASFAAKRVNEQRAKASTTAPVRIKRGMSSLMNWRDGCMVKYFALAYFAGIRPDGELQKLAKREGELINLKTGNIHIPADISKTKEERDIDISDNLMKWLKAYKKLPIVPANFDRLYKRARKSFKLSHDETRHSFISFHVALHRSIGDAALQAGNSESIVKKHYRKLHTREEGGEFFSIVPDMEKKRAIYSR